MDYFRLVVGISVAVGPGCLAGSRYCCLTRCRTPYTCRLARTKKLLHLAITRSRMDSIPAISWSVLIRVLYGALNAVRKQRFCNICKRVLSDTKLRRDTHAGAPYSITDLVSVLYTCTAASLEIPRSLPHSRRRPLSLFSALVATFWRCVLKLSFLSNTTPR